MIILWTNLAKCSQISRLRQVFRGEGIIFKEIAVSGNLTYSFTFVEAAVYRFTFVDIANSINVYPTLAI